MKLSLQLTKISEIGLFRCALGLYLLLYDLTLLSDLAKFFGPKSIINPDLLIDPAYSLLFLCWNMTGIYVLFGFLFLMTVLFSLGILNNWGLFILVILQLSFHNANPLIIHEPQQIANFFLICFFTLPLNHGPCVSLKSHVDYFIKYDEESKNIVNILILFFGLYYFIAAMKRLPDPLWREGMGLYYLLIWPPLVKDTIFSKILIASPLLYKTFNYGALVFEFAFIFFVFSKFRYILIILGVLMHIGIYLTMDVGMFSHMMFAWYVLLLDEPTRKQFKNLISPR